MKHLMYKQFISIILSISLIGTRISSSCAQHFSLAAPGDTELDTSLIESCVKNTGLKRRILSNFKGQKRWSESTKKALEKVKKLSAWARPHEVLNDPYYYALTENEWQSLCQVEPTDYLIAQEKSAIGVPQLREIIAFELQSREEVIRTKFQQGMPKLLRTYSHQMQDAALVASAYIDSRASLNYEDIDPILLPLRFSRRFGFRVLKHGLIVAIWLVAEKDKSEARIDILRDSHTAMVTGYRITEGNNKPTTHSYRAICIGEGEEKDLIITKMYVGNFAQAVRDLSMNQTIFVKGKVLKSGYFDLIFTKLFNLSININLLSGIKLSGYTAFAAFRNFVPQEVFIPAQRRSDSDDKMLPCVKIQGLKVPSFYLEEKGPHRTYYIRAFDKLTIRGEPSSEVVRVFARKADGSCGKYLFATHRRHRDKALLIEELEPKQSNFIVKGYKCIGRSSSRPGEAFLLYWKGERIILPRTFCSFNTTIELHIIRKKLDYLVLEDMALAEPLKVKVGRAKKVRITGLDIDGLKLDYVILDGVDGKGKKVYRLYLPSQIRWPLNWVRRHDFSGTLRGPLHIYDTCSERGGQLFISEAKKPKRPPRLFRHPKLLTMPLEFKFKKGELVAFSFPETHKRIPAKKWEVSMRGRMGTAELLKLLNKWRPYLSNRAKRELEKRGNLYKAAGMDLDDLKGLAEEVFVTQLERLPEGEELEEHLFNTALRQTFDTYPWKLLRKTYGISEAKIRQLSRLYSLTVKAESIGQKLSKEDIQKELNLDSEALADLLNLRKVIFRTLWQWDEPGGIRPDDEARRAEFFLSPKDFPQRMIQGAN